jgi:hypothetical protein
LRKGDVGVIVAKNDRSVPADRAAADGATEITLGTFAGIARAAPAAER